MSKNKESWGTRVGLVLAMAGNAVGFGNFLRFPVQAVQNGGGAFIIPYLSCFLLMGIPLLFVEWTLGRFGGKFGHHSTPFILQSINKNFLWRYVGVFGIFCNLAIACYYCYLESWTLSWVYHSIIGSFSGHSQQEISRFFDNYVSLSDTNGHFNLQPIIFWILCIILNTYILSRGLSGGVEKVAKFGMPLLLVFGLFLAIKATTIKSGNEGAMFDGITGLNFLWTPHFSSIWDVKVWMAAAGQIFFTLSVGMGSIQCYSSYVREEEDIALNAMSAGWMNEFVEVVLGSSVIIPIAVGYLGIENVTEIVKNGGLGLGFKALPYLFQQWGHILSIIGGVAWFGLLFFAGITSSLAMGTPVMTFLEDEFRLNKSISSLCFGILIFLLGLPTVFFFNQGVFDEYDFWSGTLALVVFAFFEVILFAWILGIDNSWKELHKGADIKIPNIYKFIIKFITPILIGGILICNSNDLFNRITNKRLHDQIELTTNPNMIIQLKNQILILNLSRFGLLLIFILIGILVHIAYKKRLSNQNYVNSNLKF